MSGNKGLNTNQNHNAKCHNTTKVLQPPGGASSFSLGGYSDYSAKTEQNSMKSYRSNNSKPPAALVRNDYNSQDNYRQQPPPMLPQNGARRQRSNSDDVGYDTLDTHISTRKTAIPGLEGHYGGGAQSNFGASDGSPMGGRSKQGKMSQQEYAAALKAQISAKRNNNFQDEPSQNNYDGGNAYSSGTSSTHSGYGRAAPGKMSSADYAAVLRAQIDSKRGGDECTGKIGERRQRRDSYGSEPNGGNSYNGGNQYNNGTQSNSYNNGNSYKENSYNQRGGDGYNGGSGSGSGAGGISGFSGMGGKSIPPVSGSRSVNPPGGRSSLQLN